MGRRFVNILVRELRGVLDRQWNLDHFIVFQTVTLQRARHATASQDIRRWIEKRLDAWEAGQFAMLVEDTLRSSAQYLTSVQQEETVEHRTKTFHGLVLRGKLRTPVRWITESKRGGVLQPYNHCTKAGERVMEVLYTKHHNARPPSATCMDTYAENLPEMVLVDITDDVVSEVAGRLSGGGGQGGTDSVSLQHWLLQFGAASSKLSQIVA